MRIAQRTPQAMKPRRTFGERAKRVPPSMTHAAARMALRPVRRAIHNAGQTSTGNGPLRFAKHTFAARDA
jgi:hypothetical protein